MPTRTHGNTDDRPAGMTEGLAPYREWIRSEPRLTAEDEHRLGARALAGDTEAQAQLVRANLRLVIAIARSYEGLGLSLDDLVGEGNLGLIEASRRYDPARASRFGSYAGHWIRQAIRQALTQTGATIRLPAHVVTLMGRWRRAERSLRRELGREPDADQVAVRLGLSTAERATVERALRARRIEPGGEDTADGNGGIMPELPDSHTAPEAALEAEEERLAIRRRLSALEERERAVLDWRFGLKDGSPATLAEIGRRLGVTKEWARKLEVRALRKLGETPAQAFFETVRADQRNRGQAHSSWDDVLDIATDLGHPPLSS